MGVDVLSGPDVALSPLEGLADFSFPLNVYAHLLAWDDGAVDYLHYGVFLPEEDAGGDAQRRASEHLMRALPPPCRLLEVGVGLGTTLARLRNAGYSVQGMTPDLAQIAEVRRRLGSDAPVVAARYEDFVAEPGSVDVILFQESAQYIDMLDIFARAACWLTSDGHVVIMDEFATCRPSGEGCEPMHYWPHVLRWAERAGFVLAAQEDLTEQAAPTIAWLSSRIRAYFGPLRALPGVTDESLAMLLQALEGYRKKYADGVYGYYLARFSRVRQSRWFATPIAPRHRVAVQGLFQSVFDSPMSDALWSWKYADGHGSAVGVWCDDQLVAHYGGMRRDVLLFGKPVVGFQACDFMVAEAERGSLSRRGPAFLAAATYLEHELGYGARYLVGVGFPNERAFRVPERLGLYRGVLARILELRWPVRLQRASLSVRVREVEIWDDAVRKHLDRCWAAMAESLQDSAVGVRDAAYLERRYRLHPEKRYRVFLISRRLRGDAVGAFVLRALHEDDGLCFELLDLVAARADVARVLHHARRAAAALGGRRLHVWVSDNLLTVFNPDGAAEVRDLEVLVPGNGWTEGPAMELLVGRWWLTGGDTDFR